MKNILFIIAVFISFSLNLSAYSGGGGTAGNPYRISNDNDVIELMETDGDWGKHFILTTNVNVAGRNLYPIGDMSKSFTGSFNGQGYKIYSSPSSNTIEIGFFGANNGEIRNLGIENIDAYNFLVSGSFCGMNEGYIVNCYSSGKAYSYMFCGAFCGMNTGLIEDCRSSGNAYGVFVAGFCGVNISGFLGSGNSSGSIKNCHSRGNAYAGYAVELLEEEEFEQAGAGSFCGVNLGGYIDACTSSGNAVSVAQVSMASGFCIYNNIGNISNCRSSGNASAEGYLAFVAGFCVINGETFIFSHSDPLTPLNDIYPLDQISPLNGPNSIIYNCYSSGNSLAESFGQGGGNFQPFENGMVALAAGFCVINTDYSEISHCHAQGNAEASTDGDELAAGFVGINDQSYISYCCSEGELTASTIAGFCGEDNNGTFNCCYYNSEKAGTEYDDANSNDLDGVDFYNNDNWILTENFEQCLLPENEWIMLSSGPFLSYFDSAVIPLLPVWAYVAMAGVLGIMLFIFNYRRLN